MCGSVPSRWLFQLRSDNEVAFLGDRAFRGQLFKGMLDRLGCLGTVEACFELEFNLVQRLNGITSFFGCDPDRTSTPVT